MPVSKGVWGIDIGQCALKAIRLEMIDGKPTATAFELIPCQRVRPSAAYFAAGHRLLDSLTRPLPVRVPAQQRPDLTLRPAVSACGPALSRP